MLADTGRGCHTVDVPLILLERGKILRLALVPDKPVKAVQAAKVSRGRLSGMAQYPLLLGNILCPAHDALQRHGEGDR